MSASELRSTGYYLPAATALNLVVHDGCLAPALVIGASDADARKEFKSPREYPLQLGRNTVTDAGGGVVYLKLIGDTGQAKVTIGEEAQGRPAHVSGGRTA
nr:M60 family peptidase N-terminal accessory domain-containing protein [Kribbella sp. VKM Ac-2569]